MTSEGPHRLHVAAAVDEALRGLGDIALPLLIGIVAGGTRSSGSALVFGLLGVVAALAIGIARWRATAYMATDRALHFRSGVFSPDETVVPLERIQAVDTIAGPVQRLVRLSGPHVQTPGGGEDGDVVLSALSRPAAAELRAALGHPDPAAGGARRRPALRRPRGAALPGAPRAAAGRPAARRGRRLRRRAERPARPRRGRGPPHRLDARDRA